MSEEVQVLDQLVQKCNISLHPTVPWEAEVESDLQDKNYFLLGETRACAAISLETFFHSSFTF
jgi:hypothetical protein